MLTIQNFERLRNKVIGKTGYYVSNILPAIVVMDMNGTHKNIYKIEITNRKQVIMLQLDRVGFMTGERLKLYELKLGQNYINLNKFQLRNMDLVINNINQLLLQDWLP